MFDYGDAQIGIVLAAVIFSQADNTGFVPGRQNSFFQKPFRRICYARSAGISLYLNNVLPMSRLRSRTVLYTHV